MEDVLEVYRRDFAEDEVLVCMDETSKQHVKETRTPVPTRPGETAKYDYEYERNGVSNLFMLCAPLAGLAPRQGDRPSYEGGLGAVNQGIGG